MVKPRVFISHSALGETTPDGSKPEALELLDLLAEALDEEFAVRIDKDDLVLGDNWRSTLNTWIGRCDAAVVLLSEKALRSPFVAYEASVLTARPNLTVIPVFLTGVDYNRVQNSPFAPSDIHRIQSIVNVPNQARRVELVKERLAEVKRGMTPVDWQAGLLEEWLKPVSVTSVRQYLVQHGAEPDPWEENDNPHLALALMLMSLGLGGATPLIRKIRDTLNSQGTLHKVFELVATSWVDVRAAQYVKQIATGERERRALALNGTKSLIAKLYVWCASELPTDDSWTVVDETGITSEQPFDELRGAIEEALRAGLKLPSGDSLEEELRLSDESDEPVFVALPAAGVNRSLMDELRAAFPTVTFFLLAGVVADGRDSLDTVEVKLIMPPLHKGFEDTFCTLYDEKRRYLKIGRL